MLLIRNNYLEKMVISTHDMDNLPALRLQVFSKLLPQYIVIGEIEREGQYNIWDKNYKNGQGEILILEKKTNQIYLLEVKVITSEKYTEKFEEYATKLIKQLAKNYTNKGEKVEQPLILCMCTLSKTNDLDIESRTQELQTIIDNKIDDLGEIGYLSNIKNNIKGKIMIVKNENE